MLSLSDSASLMSLSSPKNNSNNYDEVKNTSFELWEEHYWLVTGYIKSVINKSSGITEDFILLCQNYKELNHNFENIIRSKIAEPKLFTLLVRHTKIIKNITNFIIDRKSIIKYYEKWKETMIEISGFYHQHHNNINFERLLDILKAYMLALLNEIYNILGSNDIKTHDQKINTYICARNIADYINSTF